MRKTLVTIGLLLAWIAVVVAAVVARAFWFGAPPVERGDFDSIEKHFVGKLTEAAEKKRLGSAALVLLRGGEIAAEHGFGVGNAETAAPVKTDQTLFLVASGPSGSGKSVLATEFIMEGARNGEPGVIAVFEKPTSSECSFRSSARSASRP